MNETVKGWPIRTVIVPEYGWGIRFYDPTVEELEQITAAQNEKPRNMSKVKEIVASLIISWDCTDKKGNPSPIEAASFEKLPPVVQSTLTGGLAGRLRADPNAATGSPPVITSAPEVISPATSPES
jgi:hypothetical protein